MSMSFIQSPSPILSGSSYLLNTLPSQPQLSIQNHHDYHLNRLQEPDRFQIALNDVQFFQHKKPCDYKYKLNPFITNNPRPQYLRKQPEPTMADLLQLSFVELINIPKEHASSEHVQRLLTAFFTLPKGLRDAEMLQEIADVIFDKRLQMRQPSPSVKALVRGANHLYTSDAAVSKKSTRDRVTGDNIAELIANGRYSFVAIDIDGADLSGVSMNGVTILRSNVSRANLDKAELKGVDLRESRISWTRLTSAELEEAVLDRVDLTNANLSGSDLNRAKLVGAKLTGAHLDGANLQRASLEGARLIMAQLNDADLRGADLSGADLRKANLEGARLNGVLIDKDTQIDLPKGWQTVPTSDPSKLRIIAQTKKGWLERLVS